MQDLHQRIGGHDPVATCKGVTRKDFVYVSPELQGFFRQAQVHNDVFPDHSVLTGEFVFPQAPEPNLLWRSPSHRPRGQLQDLQLPTGQVPDLTGMTQSQKLLAVCSEYETRLSRALLLKDRQQRPAPVRKARQGDVDPQFFGHFRQACAVG